MADKQIIIDGVNVSRCSTLMEDYQIANNIEGRYEHIKNVCELGIRGVEDFWMECRNNPNCYFKQLKRKERECEELKKYLHQNFKEKDKLHLIIDRLLDASGYDTNTASAEDFEEPHPSVAKHRTEKSIECLEWLIKTYTNEGDLILDNCMGSGTTGICCRNLNRKFIGIELDKNYYDIAKKRISECEVENDT